MEKTEKLKKPGFSRMTVGPKQQERVKVPIILMIYFI